MTWPPGRPTIAQRLARLSPRERDVLALGAAGLDDDAIAARLGIGLGTVRRYWASIAQLLGLTGRADPRQRAIEQWQRATASQDEGRAP